MTQRRLSRGLFFISLLSLAPANVWAARGDQRFNLDIKPKPLTDALIELVMASNISVAGLDPKTCRAQAVAIKGTYTAEDALRLLLKGSQCDVRRFNATTFALKPAPAPAPKRSAPLPVIEAHPQDATVTVIRQPLRLSKSASTISVISNTNLIGNDQDLARLAARVPGMTLTNLGPGRDKILLRGLSDSVLTGRTQSTVGLYIDDTPLTYNAPDPDLPMVDMAQVEVLKGPQGALYGQGSLSGVVRLVSNKPDLSRLGLSVDIASGNTEGGHASSNRVAMLNLPILRDKLAIRAVAYADRAGGFIDDQINGRGVTNTTRRDGMRLNLSWQPDERTKVTVNGLTQKIASANSQYVMGLNRPYRRLLNLAEPHNNKIDAVSFGIEQAYDAGTLKLTLNHVRHTLLTGYDAQPLAQFISVPSSGVLYYEEGQDISLDTREISWVSPADKRLRWLVGIFSAASTEQFSPHLTDAYTRRVLYNENRWDRLRDLAAFGRITYDISPRLSVGGGLRIVNSRHETDSQINNVRLTGYKNAGDVDGIIDSQRFTHSVTVRYQVAPEQAIYAQHADGYRGGGFNTTTLAVTAVPSVYDGDHLDSFELGWRYNRRDGRLSVNLVGFHITWQDIQSDQLRATGLPVTVNIGNGVNSGLELEADWQPLASLTLHTAAQINAPRLTEPSALYAKDKGMGMPYISKESLSLSANWRKSLGRFNLENSAMVSYRSGSPLNYGSLRAVRMDGYTNLDLASAVSVGPVRLKLRLDNATSVRSNSFAYGNPFTVNSSAQITPVRPRTLWASLSYRY